MTPDVAARAQVEVEEEYEQTVDKTVVELRRMIKNGAISMAEVVDLVTKETGVSPATAREALSKLVYGGDVALTEDRQLVAR